MTTAQPTSGPAVASNRRHAALLVPLSAGLLGGLLLVVAGAVVDGAPGALGAGIGVAMVVAFFGFGAVVLGVVARLAPAVSLLVALLTYALQVALMGVVFLALSAGGTLGTTVDARWLSGTVIACTLVWTLAQVVAFTRTRQPVYDLPSHGSEASVR